MAFLNPLFLLGLLAAGIPLIIHLWNRRRVVTVDFSSLMFLMAAHRENARRFQLRQLLILLLRMAIVALIALALARPFLTLGLPVASVRAKTDIVIVLDNSYSMAHQDVDGIRFEKAQTLAIDIMDTLRHGDSAALILMSDIPNPVFRQLTPDLGSVTAAIHAATVSYRATNAQPSLELAHEILAESSQLNKELYLISDFTRNGWENVGARLPRPYNRSGARVSLIPVAEGEAHNTNIEEVRPSNQLIGVNLPLQLNVTTANHSVAPLAQRMLTLFIGAEKEKTVSFSAAANESLNTTLTYNFSTPGTHIGYFTLTEDRLNVDNQRYFALDVIGEVRVLCVGEQTEYLALALNPHNAPVLSRVNGAAVSKVTSPNTIDTNGIMILPTQCTPTEFESFPLEDYDVIILADVPQITRQIGAQLQEFIRHGKSVITFVSRHSNAESYNSLSDGWLPAQLGSTLTWTPPQQVRAYQEGHPIFDIFPNEGFSAQYAPQFYSGVMLRPTSESEVIAHFDDDTPFLIERNQGTSTVLLYNCGLLRRQPNTPSANAGLPRTTAATNDLLINPYFLPMLQQSVLYTATANRNLLTWSGHIGDTYTARYPRSAGGKASIRLKTTVDTTPEAAGAVADDSIVVPIAEDGTLQFRGTERPGIYQIEVRTPDRLQRDFFAVNVDAAESDLAQIPLQQVAARVGAQTTANEETGGTTVADEAYNVKRHGREIWGELLLLAVCCMLLESFLSNRGSHSLQGKGDNPDNDGALTVGEV
ncbi:VWA domain-containing protein [Candidatus Poribacteria bacterium]|nr:VWA domain-containing protein [Candidatus Poribacteria bacterium]MYG07148.1 VWA domain-containing protein [Candidatus Poribacteria bacterium]MYK22274.1 VWA domain-containing protein [Candidatus Poribacteria bacterium]